MRATSSSFTRILPSCSLSLEGEVDLRPMTSFTSLSAHSIAEGTPLPPGIVRNLLLMSPRAMADESPSSSGSIANILRYSSGSIPPNGSSPLEETLLWSSCVRRTPSDSSTSEPLSDLDFSGYRFFFFEGDRTVRMNSIVVVFPLSFGP